MSRTLSVAIIAKNEEAIIRRTLESVKWADEIVVVDSGSTDNTVAICREYTDKVFHQDWLGYAGQKNAAIDRTTGDWVLSLDADEPLEPALAGEIKRIIASPQSLDGYRIPRKTIFLGRWIKHGGWYPDYNLRLFRKGKGKFQERAVHEAIRVEGPVGNTRHAIEHHTYPDIASYLSRINSYSSLAVDVMAEKGISGFKAGWMNILCRPVLTFVHKYFFRLGFLDGKHGLVLNLFHAWYVFAKYAKAWERKGRGQRAESIEQRANAMRHAETMNVLFVNNFRGRGGGEEFLRELLPGLVRKGVKVGLVCRPGTPLEEMFKDSGIVVYPTSRSGSAALTSVFRIAGIIRNGSYDIVNIQRGHDILQAWSAARLSGRRPALLYTPQVPEFLKSRFLLGRMHGIVTISRYIRDRLIDYYPALAKRITIIYYGIDLSKFKPGSVPGGALRSRFGLVPGTPVIGTVGDLWKNQIEFLDALALIRKEFPDARFGLVASDSGIGQVQAFKDRAATLGLADAVLWTGRLNKDEMLSFYADIDVAVSTHRNEGFGIWVIEALAMGKPAVAFSAGGIRDSLENCPAGVLVKGGAEEMAAEILAILRDPVRKKRMADEGPRWTSTRFGTERMVEEYQRFFDTIVTRREHRA